MLMYPLIAFTGRKTVGKDYLAEWLIAEYGAVRVSFSDNLKIIANKVFPWCEVYYPPELKEVPIYHPNNVYGKSPRDIWKHMDSLREIDPSVFVHQTREDITENLYTTASAIIVTDIRKQVEFDMVREMGGIIIRITGDAFIDPDEWEIDTFFPNYDFHHDKSGTEKFKQFLITCGTILETPKVLETSIEND